MPAEGWNIEEQNRIGNELSKDPRDKIMASPVPYLLFILATNRGINSEMDPGRQIIYEGGLYLLHNDRREKKELPSGKIVNVVAKDGWVLVTV